MEKINKRKFQGLVKTMEGMWLTVFGETLFEGVDREQLASAIEISAKNAAKSLRPTKRVPDVKPRRAVKAKTRKASRG